MKTVYLVVGCPASGKTTVCEKLKDRFHYVPHDNYVEAAYPQVLYISTESEKPVLGEIPFGLSKIQQALENKGVRVVPLFILEKKEVLEKRWADRKLTNPSTIKGHLTRQNTYAKRARELNAFAGTACEVLEHLEGVVG